MEILFKQKIRPKMHYEWIENLLEKIRSETLKKTVKSEWNWRM